MRPFLFLMLLLGSASAVADLPVQSRELQKYWVEDGYQVAIDTDPAWQWQYQSSQTAPVFQAITPEAYYPPAVVTITLHKGVFVTSPDQEFLLTALAAANTVARKVDASLAFSKDQLLPAEYGALRGFGTTFRSTVEEQPQDTKLIVVRNRVGQVMSLQVTTLPDKLPHIEAAARRIWQNIEFLTLAE